MHQFSVIIPTFNGALFLRQTLDSLAQQTCDEFQVVVVDDGSTDETVDIARSHPVVNTVVTQPNRGVAIARNHGALVATGEWLAFLDQDDLWHSRRLERLKRIVRSRPGSMILTTDRAFGLVEDRAALATIDPMVASMASEWVERGTEVRELCSDSSRFDLQSKLSDELITTDLLLSRTALLTTSFIIRADFLRLIGGWSPHARSLDDWWLMANAARVEPLLKVDEPTHFYRLHSAATSLKPGLLFGLGTSLLALRFGGNLTPLETAIRVPQENEVLRHLFTRFAASPSVSDPQERQAAHRLGRLLWNDGWADKQLRRGAIKRRFPRITARYRTLRSSVGS